MSLIGWLIAPLPAESHAANRTHFRPAALNGISDRFARKHAANASGPEAHDGAGEAEGVFLRCACAAAGHASFMMERQIVPGRADIAAERLLRILPG